MKEQIEEMTKDLCDIDCKGMKCNICDSYGCEYRMQAEALYNAGYRKQSEGEWVETDYKTVEHGFVERRGKAWLCTNCRHASKEFNPNMNYCPNCGAKMKGGAE